jgi:DNA-binding MarR family transcriptional regulator
MQRAMIATEAIETETIADGGSTPIPGVDTRRSVLTWMRLARVFQKINRRSAESLRKSGLTLAQFDVLAQIGADEGLTQQELARKLLVTKGNVCQLLDKLEAQALVERRTVAGGRGNLLFLTPAGWEFRDRVLPAHEERIAANFDVLDREEMQTLRTILRKIDQSLDSVE